MATEQHGDGRPLPSYHDEQLAAHGDRPHRTGRSVPEVSPAPTAPPGTSAADPHRGLPVPWPRSASSPGWLLDEVRTAGRENLEPDHVARYDTKMDSGAADEVALLRRLGLGSESVLVDLGAGTGQLTLAAAAVCRRVVAVDVSPVMLERLQARVRAEALTNVEVTRGGFLTYDHHGEPADVVYTRYALHHLPDFWKALALVRMRAMLRPGGLLRLSDVVWSFGPDEAPGRIEAWCATAGTEVEGEWSREELEEHVRDEHSTFTWLLEPMIERAGFTIETVTCSEDGIDAQYVCRAT